MEYTKRVKAVTDSINLFAQGYGEEAMEKLVESILRGRSRVKTALKNIKVEE